MKDTISTKERLYDSEPYLFNHAVRSWLFAVRLAQQRRFADSVCRIVKAKPETTYDNFAADFGERFVPGYKRPSAVDFLTNAPFEE